jgi:cell division topological specificity factor
MAFWDYFFKKKTESSASHAVDRIKFVLQSDRTGLPQETLERIKNDIISVLSKYVDIETAELDFNITKAPNEHGAMTPALCANIPIKGVKRNSPADNTKAAASTTEAAKKTTGTTETAKSTETTKSNAASDELKSTESSKEVANNSTASDTAKSTETAKSGVASDSSDSSVSGAASDSTKNADATKGNTSLSGVKSEEGATKTVQATAVKTADVTKIEAASIKNVTSKSVETAVKAVEDVKKNDDDGSGLSSALDKTFVFKKD